MSVGILTPQEQLAKISVGHNIKTLNKRPEDHETSSCLHNMPLTSVGHNMPLTSVGHNTP